MVLEMTDEEQEELCFILNDEWLKIQEFLLFLDREWPSQSSEPEKENLKIVESLLDRLECYENKGGCNE